MSRLPADFEEDRMLRERARQTVAANVAQLRQSLAAQGLISRTAQTLTLNARTRIAAGARDLVTTAQGEAKANQGLIAAVGAGLLGALALWFARKRRAATARVLDEAAPDAAASSPAPGSDAAHP